MLLSSFCLILMLSVNIGSYPNKWTFLYNVGCEQLSGPSSYYHIELCIKLKKNVYGNLKKKEIYKRKKIHILKTSLNAKLKESSTDLLIGSYKSCCPCSLMGVLCPVCVALVRQR